MAKRPLYIVLNDCVSTLGCTPLDCGVQYLLKECEKMLGINELEGYRALTTLAEKVEFIASQCDVPLVEEEKEKREDTVVVAGSSSTNRKRKVKQTNVASSFVKG